MHLLVSVGPVVVKQGFYEMRHFEVNGTFRAKALNRRRDLNSSSPQEFLCAVSLGLTYTVAQPFTFGECLLRSQGDKRTFTRRPTSSDHDFQPPTQVHVKLIELGWILLILNMIDY